VKQHLISPNPAHPTKKLAFPLGCPIARLHCFIPDNPAQDHFHIDTLAVRDKNPQLEGDDFGETPQGFKAVDCALIRSVDFETHITGNAAARQRQAAP
jgi:hypothetical protein